MNASVNMYLDFGVGVMEYNTTRQLEKLTNLISEIQCYNQWLYSVNRQFPTDVLLIFPSHVKTKAEQLKDFGKIQGKKEKSNSTTQWRREDDFWNYFKKLFNLFSLGLDMTIFNSLRNKRASNQGAQFLNLFLYHHKEMMAVSFTQRRGETDLMRYFFLCRLLSPLTSAVSINWE